MFKDKHEINRDRDSGWQLPDGEKQQTRSGHPDLYASSGIYMIWEAEKGLKYLNYDPQNVNRVRRERWGYALGCTHIRCRSPVPEC